MINKIKNNFINLHIICKLKFFYTTIIILTLLYIVETILVNMQPMILSNIIDSITNKNFNILKKSISLCITFFIVELIISSLSTFLKEKFLFKIDITCKQLLFNKLITIKMNKFTNLEYGQIINIIDKDSEAISFLISEIINIVLDFLQVLFVGWLLVYINYKLTFVSMISFPIIYFLSLFYSRKFKKLETQYKNNVDKYYSFINDIIKNFIFVISNSNENIFIEKFKNNLIKLYRLNKNRLKLKTKQTILTQLINIIQEIAVIIFAIVLIFKGNITLGQFIAFKSYSVMFSQSLSNIVNLNSRLQQSFVCLNRIEQFLEIESYNNTKALINKDINYYGNIELKNLTFKFEDRIILNNLSINIEGKKINLLRGKSGIGKSTILFLLSGIHNNYVGDIFIDDIDIRKISIKEHVSLLSQENKLFSMSIIDNFKLGDANVTFDKVAELCKLVNIYDRINLLPEKFDTIINSTNNILSFGETQRLLLAIALVKKSEILLLDEITSNLDAYNEVQIMNALKKISNDKTIVIISHKDEVIDYADNVILI